MGLDCFGIIASFPHCLTNISYIYVLSFSKIILKQLDMYSGLKILILVQFKKKKRFCCTAKYIFLSSFKVGSSLLLSHFSGLEVYFYLIHLQNPNEFWDLIQSLLIDRCMSPFWIKFQCDLCGETPNVCTIISGIPIITLVYALSTIFVC